MNHLDRDESSRWDDDIDAFEQQLRAIRPTDPALPWAAIEETLETRLSVAPVGGKASVWRSIISHAVTAAIGLAVGVALMLMQSAKVPASVDAAGEPRDTVGSVEMAEQQSSSAVRSIADDQESTIAEKAQQPQYRRWNSLRFSDASLRAGSLRAFGEIGDRLVSGRDQDRRDQSIGGSSDFQVEDSSADGPVLSPRSLDVFLKDLTRSPSLKNPVSSVARSSS